jgi:very-short-patch-repair endonuclease
MPKYKYNWKEIQKFYDKGNTFRDIEREFGVNSVSICKARKRGDFISRSNSEAQKLSQKKNPRKHSEETKKKLSKIRTEYLKKNPDKVPYLLNHHSKGMSYPEKYFEKLFRNENIELVYHFQIGLYQLDFSDPVRKIDIEIDGEQHYVDKKIFKSDRRRDKFLQDLGWITYRVRWSHYMKMDMDTKKLVVQQIKELVKNRRTKSEVDISIQDFMNSLVDKKKPKKIKKCICGKDIGSRSTYCKSCKPEKIKKKCELCLNMINKVSSLCPSCFHLGNRKVERPSKEELEKMIKEMSWTAIGKMYNVSDNAVRKWARSYGIEWKKRKKSN